MTAADAPVIVGALRTPIGTAGMALRDVAAADLAAPVLKALAAAFPTSPVTDVILGSCMGPGGDVARVASLAAGLPFEVPGLTVDRQCGSGLAAVDIAAAMLRTRPGLVLAGGVESASTAPWRFWPPVDGAAPVRYERAPFAPAELGDPDMGVAADALAAERGIGRVRQDEYAARSHIRAATAWGEGVFDSEIVPVAGLGRDERVRPGVTANRLARLRPAFVEGGTVTAGNSCGVSDGAAVVVMVDATTFARLDAPGLQVLATATAGVHPRWPGLGLVPAVRRALEVAGVRLDDIDAIEFNEAFAGQVLACCDELGLDEERVCTDGGALALGHPWGASGAVLAVRLFSRLVRADSGTLGLAAIAVGGGQGVALVVKRCR